MSAKDVPAPKSQCAIPTEAYNAGLMGCVAQCSPSAVHAPNMCVPQRVCPKMPDMNSPQYNTPYMRALQN